MRPPCSSRKPSYILIHMLDIFYSFMVLSFFFISLNMIFYLTFEHLCSVMMVLYIVMGGAVCRVGSSFTLTKCAVQDHVNHWMLSACLSVCPSVPLFIDQDNSWNSEQILSLDRVCTIMQGCKWLAFGCKRSMVTGSWSV